MNLGSWGDEGWVEQPSRFSFEDTLRRISEAIAKAGLTVFAAIDHADNARRAGLTMPASTVLIYGAAAGGTPIMLARPRSALDLPLRVLVWRADADRVLVAFHPVVPLLEDAGVPADLASRLRPAQDLLLRAIKA